MANTIKLGNGNWATKEGSLLAYNDENNNFKPLPFTTTRASSATVVNKQGLIETVGSGIPRIDFSDDTKGALLLENSSTNLITYSEDFSQWSLDGGTQSVTPNYAVSPDGTQNAYRLQLDKTGVSYSRMYLDAGTIGEKTSSIWIKSNNNSTQNVGLRYDGVGVNLEITSVWKRFELTAISITVSRFQVILLDSIAGNDESCDIQIYGAQLEQGSYATSYIKTVGTTQTRSADTANGAGNSTVINSTEGVLYAEISALANDLTVRYISLTDGTSANEVYLRFDTISNRIVATVSAGGVSVASFITTLYNIVNSNKIAIKYKTNDFALWVNGTEVASDPIGNSFSANVLNNLSFSRNNIQNFYGKAKSVQVYTTALTDAELTTLTTI